MILPYPDEDVAEPFTTNALFNGVRLSTRVMSSVGATRCGHWCEAYPVSADVIALSIGDVRGDGYEKFEAMAAIRGVVRFATRGGLDPAQTLTQASHFINAHAPQERVSAIVGLLDTRRRSLTYANAGHPAPLMVGPYGTLFLQFPGPDLPLGDLNARVTTHVVNTPAATMFVFYTFPHATPQVEDAAILTAWTPHMPMVRRRTHWRRGSP